MGGSSQNPKAPLADLRYVVPPTRCSCQWPEAQNKNPLAPKGRRGFVVIAYRSPNFTVELRGFEPLAY
jgi:hypothetical protein